MRITILIIGIVFCSYVFAQEDISFEVPPEIEGFPEELSSIPISPLPEEIAPPEEIVTPKKKTREEKAQPKVKVEESKVYLDFRDTDIKEVARILSKISGVSILVSEDVKAKVTLNIEGVSWRKALELILKTYNLTYLEKDGFIIIVTYKKIQEEQEQIPLVTKILTLNFADMNEAKAYLKSMMTKRGNLEGDKRTNSLIVTDTPEVIEKIEGIVNRLDKKTPQVLIEVLMVDRKLVDDFDFGINWTLYDKNVANQERRIVQSLRSGQDNLINYGKSIFGHAYLTGLLDTLKQDANTNILANPRVLTLDNVTAEIYITDQVPYTSSTTTDEGTVTSIQFKDVGIKVSVKPHITPDGHTIMDISTEQSFVNYFVTQTDGSQQPVIGTRKSENTMLVKDGETIVIGGLRKRERKVTIKKLPLLGDIPFLGKVFRSYTRDDETRELLIFVTPHIVKTVELTKEEEDFLSESKEMLHIKKGEDFLSESKEMPHLKREEETIPSEPEEIPYFEELELLPVIHPDEKT